MKGEFKYTRREGLPGGANEMKQFAQGKFSIDGYKRFSPDVNNPFNIIPSGDITMKDVDFPVHGVDNLGNSQIMYPGNDYKFPGSTVFETPLHDLDDYEEAELTDEQIAELRAQGIKVEEVDKFQEDGATHTYNGTNYRKEGDVWLKEVNGKFVPMTKGNVAERYKELNKNATPIKKEYPKEWDELGKLLNQKLINRPTTVAEADQMIDNGSLIGYETWEQRKQREIREAQERKEAREKSLSDYKKRYDQTNFIGQLPGENWRETFYNEAEPLDAMFRISQEDNFFDDYLNPFALIGSMGKALGQAPKIAKETDSYMPYVTSIGIPLSGGALAGIGAGSTSQFVNNMFNPFAGTGAYFTSKFPLRNAYKLNSKALKEAPLNTLYHGSNNPNLQFDDIIFTDVNPNVGARPGQFKQRALASGDPLELPGGFYTNDLSTPKFMGNFDYRYSMNIPADAKVFKWTSGISDNISVKKLQELKNKGYDIIEGKNVLGQTEYIPLNKDIISNWKKFEAGAPELEAARNIRFKTETPHWWKGYPKQLSGSSQIEKQFGLSIDELNTKGIVKKLKDVEKNVDLGIGKYDHTNLIEYENGLQLHTYSKPGSKVDDVILVFDPKTNENIAYMRKYLKGDFPSKGGVWEDLPTNEWHIKADMPTVNKDLVKFANKELEKIVQVKPIKYESNTISTDGLRYWNQQQKHGYSAIDDFTTPSVSAAGKDDLFKNLKYSNDDNAFEAVKFATKEDAIEGAARLENLMKNQGLDYKVIINNDNTLKIDLPKLQRAYYKGGPVFQDGGEYIKAELTPEDIKELKKHGYYIEEYQDGGEEKDPDPKTMQEVNITPLSRFYGEYDAQNPYADFFRSKKAKYLSRGDMGLQKWFNINERNFPEAEINRIYDEYQYNRNNYAIEQFAKENNIDLTDRESIMNNPANAKLLSKAMENSKYGKYLQPSLWARTKAGAVSAANALLDGPQGVYGPTFTPDIKGLTPAEEAEYYYPNSTLQKVGNVADVLSFVDIPGTALMNQLTDNRDYAENPSTLGEIASGTLNARTSPATAAVPSILLSPTGLYNVPDLVSTSIRGLGKVGKYADDAAVALVNAGKKSKQLPGSPNIVGSYDDIVEFKKYYENPPDNDLLRYFSSPDVRIKYGSGTVDINNPNEFAIARRNFDENVAPNVERILDEKIARSKDPRGYALLVEQEKEFLKSKGVKKEYLDELAKTAADSRIKELESIKENKAWDITTKDNAYHFSGSNPNNVITDQFTSDFTNNKIVTADTPIDEITPDQYEQFIANKGFSLKKKERMFEHGIYPNQGNRVLFGTYHNDPRSIAHEFGHASQANRILPIEERLREAANPTSLDGTETLELTDNLQNQYNYFNKNWSASKRQTIEPLPFAQETKQMLLDRGIIKDWFEPITEETLIRARKSFDEQPAGVYDPQTKTFFSDSRMLDFTHPSRYKMLAKELNKIAPATILGTGAAAGLMDNKKIGGETELTKYQTKGEVKNRKAEWEKYEKELSMPKIVAKSKYLQELLAAKQEWEKAQTNKVESSYMPIEARMNKLDPRNNPFIQSSLPDAEYYKPERKVIDRYIPEDVTQGNNAGKYNNPNLYENVIKDNYIPENYNFNQPNNAGKYNNPDLYENAAEEKTQPIEKVQADASNINLQDYTALLNPLNNPILKAALNVDPSYYAPKKVSKYNNPNLYEDPQLHKVSDDSFNWSDLFNIEKSIGGKHNKKISYTHISPAQGVMDAMHQYGDLASNYFTRQNLKGNKEAEVKTKSLFELGNEEITDGQESVLTEPIKFSEDFEIKDKRFNPSGRRVYRQEYFDLNNLKLGYRNRGNFDPINTQSGAITSFHAFEKKNDYLKKHKLIPNDATFIGINSNGKFKSGSISDFDSNDFITRTVSNVVDKFLLNADGTVKLDKRNKDNPNNPVPVVKVIENGQEKLGSLNLLAKDKKDAVNEYGPIQGGRVILKGADGSQVFVSGSIQNVYEAFKEIRERTNKPVTIITLDNGAYNMGIRTKDNRLTTQDLQAYDKQHVGGGNFLYLLNDNQSFFPDDFPIEKYSSRRDIPDYSSKINSPTAKLFKENVIDPGYKYGMSTDDELKKLNYQGKGLGNDPYIDCSGAVCKVMNAKGVNLGNPLATNAQKIHDNTISVKDKSDWRDGDIITFATEGNKIDHIGFLIIDQKTGEKYIAESARSFNEGRIVPFQERIDYLKFVYPDLKYYIRTTNDNSTFKTGGEYFDAKLTPEEINWYLSQGYKLKILE